jgi:hypothetical protein
VDAIDLRALIQDHALQRRADGVQPEEDRLNGAMLRNLLDGLDAVGAPLERVVLYQGGAGRVWIGEIRRDVPARSVRSTREGTRVPTVRCREFLRWVDRMLAARRSACSGTAERTGPPAPTRAMMAEIRRALVAGANGIIGKALMLREPESSRARPHSA